MQVALIYIFPRLDQRKYIPAARRFVRSYLEHPPGATPHDIYAVINGDKPHPMDEQMFSPIGAKLFEHDNSGRDIGAFQACAKAIPADLMIFCGAHVHFRKAGWLDVMVNAFERNGPGVYGAYAFAEPAPHIRTTCFWMPPEFLNSYPMAVSNDRRYEFEHGRTHSIVKWVKDLGLEAWMVTWTGIFPQKNWRHVENQEALILDQHSDTIGYT